MISKHKMDRLCLMAAIIGSKGSFGPEHDARSAIELYNAIEQLLTREVPDAVGDPEGQHNEYRPE